MKIDGLDLNKLLCGRTGVVAVVFFIFQWKVCHKWITENIIEKDVWNQERCGRTMYCWRCFPYFPVEFMSQLYQRQNYQERCLDSKVRFHFFFTICHFTYSRCIVHIEAELEKTCIFSFFHKYKRKINNNYVLALCFSYTITKMKQTWISAKNSPKKLMKKFEQFLCKQWKK